MNERLGTNNGNQFQSKITNLIKFVGKVRLFTTVNLLEYIRKDIYMLATSQ